MNGALMTPTARVLSVLGVFRARVLRLLQSSAISYATTEPFPQYDLTRP